MPKKPPTFRPAHLGSVEASRSDYEQRRGSARRRGYDARWERASAQHKADFPLCAGCLAVGRYTATAVTDHVVPHRGDPTLFWDRDNWQSACAWHHDVVKARLEHMVDRGEMERPALRLDSADARRLTLLLAPTPA